ncbi:heparinase II/III family protein [Proteiniphilum sp. UBA1028]|jgi:hypothetical protein|uniref:heparinase II/III family protein n=1 Tax=Proteiniphilum sp. UBA1028 TaxID=1947251 RepID=UPI000EF0D960|nr:heparinase II/III-family protein [Proteiniphilum sp. UBA1028]HCF80343.1 heparinase [Porphyromonadaceae bacterium]
MKKYIFTFLFLSIMFLQANAYTEKNLLQKSASLEQVKSALILNQQWVPYPAYTDRAGWEKILGETTKAQLIKNGEKALSHEWELVKLTDYLEYEKSGNRQIMEAPLGRNLLAITHLLLAELAEGEGRFIDQLMNGVFAACEMTSWVPSAHLTLQNSKRTIPDHNEHVIDLTSGDMGSLLSWTYYFFHREFDKVNPIISERLRHELQERILDTYMNEDRFWWMAFNLKPGDMVNNWNPWCNFNVLQCFLLLENDQEKLAKAVHRTMRSVDEFINYTHEDGGCEEGPSYWGHAAGKMYDYLQILSDGTGGRISIFDKPIIRNMGEYIVRSYVGNGWVVNFADASARGGGDAPLIYRYGKAVKSHMMIQQAAYLNKNKLSTSRDIFRSLQNILYANELNSLGSTQPRPSFSWYPETEFCYMTNKSGFFIATKGGYNNESHNHNDLGTFSLYMNNTPILIDAGVGTYTRQTFSSERYAIWTMQSKYHNLPTINGVPQAFGSQYKAMNTSFNPKKMSFSTDIARAYPEEARVKRWVRSYSLSNDKVLIQDDFSLEEATHANEVHFLTWGDIDTSEKGKVKIQVENQKALLSYDKNDFDVSLETIQLDDPRLSNVWGNEIYRLTLAAKKTNKRGTYRYTVQQVK